MQLRCALVPLALALLVACEPPPKHRTWSRTTPSRSDDSDTSRLTHEQLDQFRTKALEERKPYPVLQYARALARFSWEVDELLDARDRAARDPEYKYVPPADLADFDLQAYVNELEQLVAEVEASYGYQPKTDLLLHFLYDDCEWISTRVAYNSICTENDSDFEYAYAACGDYGSTCRKALDMLTEPKRRFSVMLKCNKTMTGDKRSVSALATWATPEEVEFFEVMLAEGQRKLNQLATYSAMAEAGVEQENERRMQQYQEDLDNYEANRPAIDSKSQIGSLDGSNQPPAAPELKEYRGISLPSKNDVARLHGSTVTLTIESQCKKKLDIDLLHPVYRTGIEAGKLKRGKAVTLEVPRCTYVTLYEPDDPKTDRYDAHKSGSANAWEVQSLRLLEDCETLIADRPEYAKSLPPPPEPTHFDGPPPPPPE